MANRIQLRHGNSIPTTSNLLPYELGWDGSTLYINNGATTPAVIPIAGANFVTNSGNNGFLYRLNNVVSSKELCKSLWTGDWQGADTTITVNGITNYQMFIVHFKQTGNTEELGTSALVFLTYANGQYYFRGEGGYCSSDSAEIRIYISAELSNSTLTLISCHQINASGTRVNRAVSEIIGII